MEFVLVTFPTLRPVRMDGARQGQTGQIIGVQRGNHIFDLGSPQDYAPPSVPAVVANTSQMQPLVIPFRRVALRVSVGGPAARRGTGAGGKKAASTKKKKSTRKRASRKTSTATKRASARQPKKRRASRKKAK